MNRPSRDMRTEFLKTKCSTTGRMRGAGQFVRTENRIEFLKTESERAEALHRTIGHANSQFCFEKQKPTAAEAVLWNTNPSRSSPANSQEPNVLSTSLSQHSVYQRAAG